MDAAALRLHLKTGLTTVCRCWKVTRTDGVAFGFTDHDEDVEFGQVVFRADTGLSARALQQSTGLAVDNTEAVGALSASVLSDADIEAGRFDGAKVEAWLVNWADPVARALQFRGTLGEIERQGGAFRAELRGLSEPLNRPFGRAFQRPCSAALGDAACGVDLGDPAYVTEVAVASMPGRAELVLPDLPGFASGWFERGVVTVLDGAARGLVASVKRDRVETGARRLTLWREIRAEVAPGDLVRVTAGCDKRAETCRGKFDNFLNFRGFPHVPGEDWQMSYPAEGGIHDGGSLNR